MGSSTDRNPPDQCELIIYACPTGLLAHQIELFYQKSQQLCGPNMAHNYMPHCSLTGFFRDEPRAIADYLDTLDAVYQQVLELRPRDAISITGMTFNPQWHGLTVRSPWLKQLVARFSQAAISPTRITPIRLKDWLHVSLAYEFLPEQARSLQMLAEQHIKPCAEVSWELRFYRRELGNHWICYEQWELS